MSSSSSSLSLVSSPLKSPLSKSSTKKTTNMISGGSRNSCNHVRVVVRIRPLTTHECIHQSQPSVTTSFGTTMCNDHNTKESHPLPPHGNTNTHENAVSSIPDGDDTSVTASSITSCRSSTSSKSKCSTTSTSRHSIFAKLRPPKQFMKQILLQPRKSSNGIGNSKSATTTTTNSEEIQESQSPPLRQQHILLYPTICRAANRNYEFDTVYGPETTNKELYHHCFGGGNHTSCDNTYNNSNNNILTHDMFHHPPQTPNGTDGTSSNSSNNNNNHKNYITIVAYGMTGTGKTHTMSTNDGIMYHVVQDLFRKCNDADSSSSSSNTKTTIKMSCFEIYSDEIHDLLINDVDLPSGSSSSSNHDHLSTTTTTNIVTKKSLLSPVPVVGSGLKLRDHGGHVSIVGGLHERFVRTPAETIRILQQAHQHRRRTCATLLNDQSSRSHAMTIFTITSTTTMTVVNKNSNNSQTINPVATTTTTTTTTLTLVDLAGSERIKDSGVTGMNRKESIQINTDLFVLGKVISSLQQQGPKPVHVPYRDSKLTRLLRNALGGGGNGNSNNSCRTIFIACVSPSELHMDETLNTLRYAERARSIVSNNTNNTSSKLSDASTMTATQILALQEENTILRARITNLSRRQVLTNDFVNNNNGTIITGMERGGIQLSNIVTKLQRAKQEAATIRQHTTSFHYNTGNSTKQQQRNTIELETMCESLRQEVDFVNSENDILRLQTNRLQEEIKRLRIMTGGSGSLNAKNSYDDEDENDVVHQPKKENVSSDHEKIRSHAERLLNWADEAIDRNHRSSNKGDDIDTGDNSTGSSNTSNGTDLRPLRSSNNVDVTSCAIFRARSLAENNENNCFIRNMSSVNSSSEDAMNGCPCKESVFSKQPDVVDFYLPKLGLFCSCGRKDTVPLIGSDPCRIENILREWQVQFCKFHDIQTAADLLHAYTRQTSNQLAKQMRTWRKANGMKSVKTKSCSIAIRIWAQTCKAVMKAIRIQKDSGLIVRPNFLDVALASDTLSVSTLGFCASSDADMADLEEIEVKE